MVVVTVARKPLQESTVAANVQAVGLGALDIDGSRIATSSPGPGSTPSGCKHRHVAGAPAVRVPYIAGVGRWPANLVLEHLPGCRETGETRVEKGRARYATPRPGYARPGFSGMDSLSAVNDQFPDEEIPVKDMDEQSTFSHPSYQESRGGDAPSRGSTWDLQRASRYGSSGYQDGQRGGASRFFRTIKRDK